MAAAHPGALADASAARPASAWELVFDGGSKGNPGIGYGSYRLRPPGKGWDEPVRLRFGDRVTNNEAEYRALIAAFEDVARRAPTASMAVVVNGDSQLVIRQLQGQWRVKADNLRPLFAAARHAAARFQRVTYRWHRRERSVELLGH